MLTSWLRKYWLWVLAILIALALLHRPILSFLFSVSVWLAYR